MASMQLGNKAILCMWSMHFKNEGETGQKAHSTGRDT